MRYTLQSRLSAIRYPLSAHAGVAVLPTVLVIFALVLVVGLGITAVSISETITAGVQKDSEEAFAVAEAGVNDALMKIARDKDFTSAGYTLSVGGGTATITVTGTSPKTITSTGTVSNKTRKIQVVVTVDANGKVTQTSWQEIP